MTTTTERIAELTAAWEEGANYGEASPTVCASDYALTEDDYRAYLNDDEAAEIVALIERQAENQERAERIARRIIGEDALAGVGYEKYLKYATAAALEALTEMENPR